MNAVFNWGALSRRSSLEVGLWGRQTPLASRSRPAVAEKACCRRVTPSPRVSSLHLARIGSTSVSTAWDVVRFCRNFPCPTERSCPFLAYWVSCCLRVLSPMLPLSHLITSTQDATQTYPPGGGTLVTSATLQRQFAVPLLESFASHSPPLGSRFCSSFLHFRTVWSWHSSPTLPVSPLLRGTTAAVTKTGIVDRYDLHESAQVSGCLIAWRLS